jgi:PadR family transcriptional regulator PadR
MAPTAFDRELKKGNTELVTLTLLERRPRHGYEICKLIEERSGGALRLNVASLYPLLYRLEQQKLIKGRWVEKAGQRRKRHYTITVAGRTLLAERRSGWNTFIDALVRVAGLRHA